MKVKIPNQKITGLDRILAWSPVPIVGKRMALKICRRELEREYHEMGYVSISESHLESFEKDVDQRANQLRSVAYLAWGMAGTLAGVYISG